MKNYLWSSLILLFFLIVVAGEMRVIGAPATDAQTVQQIGSVFVIALENHNFTQPHPTKEPQQLRGNPAAPYINSLITPGNSNAAEVSYAMRYYNAGKGVHPSECSYVWSEAGSDFNIHTDADPNPVDNNVFNVPHLTRLMNAAHILWKSYQEDFEFARLPTSSVSGKTMIPNLYNHVARYAYAVKHNPMAFFNDTRYQNMYSLTNLAQDLANNMVGRYNWITPNVWNDMHSALSEGFDYHGAHYTKQQAEVAQGDNFLSILIPQIMASRAYKYNGAIIIWTDETEGGDDTNYALPEIVISPLAKGNAYASSKVMSHSSDLKTMLEIFDLTFTSNAVPAAETNALGGYNNVATVNDLSDLFVRPSPQGE
ncbi:MAG TPA: alkaline phosphatase family protein [Verrucomicrobiae bacterium]|jgi:hypothetical protein|nr:alkaline phosphatase family protein [Verrucomicrobiae bacterium]